MTPNESMNAETPVNAEAPVGETPPSLPEPASATPPEAPSTEIPVSETPPVAEPTAEVGNPEATAETVTQEPSGESASGSDDVLESATAEVATPGRPSLPAQPVPQVPPSPQPQDLSRVAQDLQIRKAQVEAVHQLLDSGNTVPFITRYRKERTGGLDEEVIRRIQDRLTFLRELASKKQTILRSIANQGRLTDELTDAILHAENQKRLDDLYLPYKHKKRTLASDAREKGLEPLAMAIWNRDEAVSNLAEVLPGIVDPWKQLHDVETVLTGVKHILAEVIAEMATVRGPLRAFYWDLGQLASVKVETLPEGKGTEYRDYFEAKEPIRTIPPHRILAINRGERENVLRVRIDVPNVQAVEIAIGILPLADHPHRELLLPVVEDAVNRLMIPSLEREARRELTEFAQDHSVDVFARNLRSLLMRSPLGGKSLLAIDPGVRTGCKLAVLDATGNLIEHATMYPFGQNKKPTEAKLILEQLIRKHQLSLIAIGNGTACRDTEAMVADLISEFEQRRINPAPATAPIEPMTTSTSTPTAMVPDSPSLPTEAVTTMVLPGLAETAMFTPTTVTTELTQLHDMNTALPTTAEPAQEVSQTTETITTSVTESSVASAAVPPPPKIDLSGLAEPPADLAYVIVNEAGASEYSASTLAKDEFPDLDATVRGTVSIGRRLQDPLAELVKIEPQHIGVGLYQHDVRAKYLKQSVERIVESCVNAVGVDLNTASVQLLKNVSGLNVLAAKELVEFRKQNGAFQAREQLMSVPQMGDARFTQAAGFLRIRDGSNPLDNTSIHPESYGLATQILAELGFTPEDLKDKEKVRELRQKMNDAKPDEIAERLGAGSPTIWDIFDALAKPGRDPRSDHPGPIFRKGILKLEDLKPGLELRGEVLNVVDFGVFVDVGLKDSGLVHVSQVANRYIRSPHEVCSVGDVVNVWVLNIDMDRKRVSLSMIPPGVERKPQGPPRGQRPQGERAERPQGERGERPQGPPRQFQGDRPQQGERPPQGDRPPRPQQDRAPRPQPVGQGPSGGTGQGPPQRPPMGGGGRPGGGGGRPSGPRPGQPGYQGWRSRGAQPGQGQGQGPARGNAPANPPAPADGAPPAEGAKPATPPAAAPAPVKKAKPKNAPSLNTSQKTGKEPVYSFAQLAALLKNKDEPAPPTPEQKQDKPTENPPA
jgi:protein Tex